MSDLNYGGLAALEDLVNMLFEKSLIGLLAGSPDKGCLVITADHGMPQAMLECCWYLFYGGLYEDAMFFRSFAISGI